MPFASESFSGQGDVYGSNQNSEKVRRFSLPSRQPSPEEIAGSRRSDILLIEDNPIDCRLVCTALEKNGVRGELVWISDGGTAIEYLASLQSEPDLIIVDINLPKRSGFEVIEFLKNSTSFQSLRTVTLTSSQDAKDRDRAHALGVFRFLNKPLHLDEFIRLGEIFKEIMVSRGT